MHLMSPAKQFLAIAAASSMVAGALAFLVSIQYRQVLAGWHERQSNIAADRTLLVTNWLQERRGDAEVNSRSPVLLAFLSRMSGAGNPGGQAGHTELPHLAQLNLTKEFYGYQGIYVLDRNGQVVSQADGSPRPSELLPAMARKALRNGEFQIDWFPEGPNRDSLYLTSLVPGKGEKVAAGQRDRNPAGVVILMVDLYRTLLPMLASETVPTKTGETILVTRTSGGTVYLSSLRGSSDGLHRAPSGATTAANVALEGRPTFGEYTDYRGVTVLAATRGIPLAGWGLVSKIDRREALAEFYRHTLAESGIVGLLLLALGGWFFGYRRHIWARFLNLREQEFRGLLESTPDGLVILNTGGRIVFVNSPTESLFGYGRKELVGQSFGLLVPEATWGGSFRANTSRSLEASAVEASGRHRNSTVFPVELVFRPVVNSGGHLFCVAIRDLTERKRIESILEHTEEQYAELFNSGNDAAFVLELGEGKLPGRILEVNEMACQRLGYTRDELLERTTEDLHTPENFTALAPVGDSLRAGQSALFETEHLARNGQLIPTEINARAIQFRGRRAVLAVARDITDRKKAEASLKASECRYRRYIERSAAAFLRTSLDGEVLECNDSTVRILGYGSQEEIKSHRISEFYQIAFAREEAIELLKAEKVVNGYEICLKRKDGSPVWVLMNLTLVAEEGSASFIEGTAIDITDRKRMEKELRTIASVVEASTDFIGFASIDGEVQFINRAGRRMIGLDEDGPVPSKPILEHVLEEDREQFLRNVLPLTAREGQWAGETRFKNVNSGVPIPMWQSIFFITEPETNRRIALATVCRDLTGRKREEQELQAAKEAAEAGNHAKSRFLANMSHEIRTPMNGILGMAHLLLSTELSDEQRHYAEVVMSSGNNLLSIVNDILDLSKVEAGKVVLEKLDFELGSFLDGVAQTLGLEARRKGLEFTCRADPGVPRLLQGDPGRLRQVIVNLASNAIKFTSRGSVTIRVEVDSQDDRMAVVRFGVADTGIGITKAQAKILFSPFMQADESTTRRFGGTGLGLAISKQLIAFMGGQIGFESEPGKGQYCSLNEHCHDILF